MYPAGSSILSLTFSFLVKDWLYMECVPNCHAVFIVNDNLGWASKVGVAVTCECDLHHGLILALALGCKPPPPQTTPPPPPLQKKVI